MTFEDLLLIYQILKKDAKNLLDKHERLDKLQVKERNEDKRNAIIDKMDDIRVDLHDIESVLEKIEKIVIIK